MVISDNVNGLPSQSEASDIVLDESGSVYVTGYSYAPVTLLYRDAQQ